MPDITEYQVYHVEAWSHGLNVYKGIESLEVRRVGNRVLPFRSELATTPDIIEKVGSDELPVTFTVRSRSKSTLTALVAEAKADVTVKVKVAGQANPVTVTLASVVYLDSTLSVSRDQKGFFTVQGIATSVTFPDPA